MDGTWVGDGWMVEGRLMTGNGMEDPPNELGRWIWE